MQILFKVSNTGGMPAKVSDSNLQEHYSGIHPELAWARVLPSIRRATIDYLIPHISEELYTDLATAYHSVNPLSAEQTEFLERCQDCVAYYAVLLISPELNVSASPMGMVEKGSTQAPVMPVAQWRFRDFRYDLAKKADRILDSVISLLEKYVHDNVEFFNAWKESSAYTDHRTTFFQTAEEFDKYIKISKSRRLFAAIQQDIYMVEEEIDKVICEEQFNALSDALKDGDPTAEENALIDRIRRYVASKAMASAVPGLSVHLDATTGLSLSSYSDGMESLTHMSSAFRGAEAVGAYTLKLRTDADRHRQELMNFIYSNIDDYPLIGDSECYARFNASKVGPISTGRGGIML